MCFACSWFFQPGEYHETITGETPFTCLAFYPEPIPDEIIEGEFFHNNLHPAQQNEIVFSPLDNFKPPGK
jgi:hypothetical protein